MDKMLVVVFPNEGEAKASYQQRTEKLRKAWERTKERWGTSSSSDR